jgi:glycosyltransferase involved in cell wall biosynthesis
LKHIVFVINQDWYFYSHWLERARTMKREGYRVYLLVPAGNKIKLLKKEGFDILLTKLTRKGVNPLVEIASFLDLYKQIVKVKPDLLINITIKPNLYGSWIGKILGVPVVSNITGLGHVFSNRAWKYRIAKFFIKKLYRSACVPQNHRMVFQNKDDLSLFINNKIITPENTRLIPGAGVNTEQFKPKADREVGPVRVLLASRMLWDKGIGDLIMATEILKKRNLNFELLIAGLLDLGTPGAIPEKMLLQWEREGLIQWLGKRDDMVRLIPSVDISILPTCYGEGIPRFLIESASCGKAIVTTDIAGCREIVQDGVNGLLVTPKNPLALADSLEQLILDKKLREKMGEEGRRLVEYFFAEPIIIRQTLEVYKELINV